MDSAWIKRWENLGRAAVSVESWASGGPPPALPRMAAGHLELRVRRWHRSVKLAPGLFK